MRSPRETIAATRAAAAALAALGKAADVPIVTPPFERAAALAEELRRRGKPSGAGGGDVGIALFPIAPVARRSRRGPPPLGWTSWMLRIDRQGHSPPGRRHNDNRTRYA